MTYYSENNTGEFYESLNESLSDGSKPDIGYLVSSLSKNMISKNI